MKQILKSPAPRELTQWFKAQHSSDQGQINCRYPNLPSDIRSIIKQRLLEDQGYICCYTGIRINDDRSHIEHLKPQSRYFKNNEDVDYDNLLAAYPGANANQCLYGAHAKADWYDEDHLISPLSSQCETAFQFDLEGRIQSTASNTAAQNTTDRLKLNDASLTEMRQQAIQGLLFDDSISIKQAEKLLAEIYQKDSHQKLRPFCFVLKQACEKYIHRAQQKQAKQKAIQKQNPKK